VDDYRRLRTAADRGGRFVVIGGGFIGSEIAAALAMSDQQVTIVFPEGGIGGRVFPRDLATSLNDYYRDKGVEVLASQSVEGVQTRGGHSTLYTSGGRELDADVIVAGIGIQPNVELAERAGIKVDDGIVVDEFLRVGHGDVYAAGDAVSFHCPPLDKRIRFEHEDNANTMGRHAGRNMAGAEEPYRHLPYFYSDLFDLGYEAVGETKAELETIADWDEPFRKGVVYYLHEGRIRGVLLWNVWDQVEAARSLIASTKLLSPEDLRSRSEEAKGKTVLRA
jgi:NADPH-dependent 2,4-dienoyl-CoA reductase/sulfur reductase-like enzyme